MRLLGIFLILGAVAIGTSQKRVLWESYALPLAFVIWSFQSPYRRARGISYYVGLALLGVAVAVAAVVVVYRSLGWTYSAY